MGMMYHFQLSSKKSFVSYVYKGVHIYAVPLNNHGTTLNKIGQIIAACKIL
jgi:hypothetical protein